jgi:enamine deaminase RidA (YjgF/YER057c/UK114 family)
MTIRDIRPVDFPWFRYENYTFSLGLTDGRNAWLSGHSASTYDGGQGRIVVVGGMGEQSETAYAKIGTILAAAGLGWHDVTHIVENVTVSGIGSYPEAEQVRLSVFGEHSPVVSTVVVDRLLRPAALIEIEVNASAGGGNALHISHAGRWRQGTVRAGWDDAVYLPTVVPVDADGGVVAEGDFRGQYTYCLERAAQMLGEVGLDLSHVVKTVDYSTPATREVYPRSGRPRKDLLGPVYPGAAGILMSRLHAPGVLVALDITASRHPSVPVNPGWSRYETLTYNPGVLAGRTLYLSGFAALDPETQRAVYPGEVIAQARFIYENVLQVLAAAGGGPEHLLRTVEYVCPKALPDYRGVAGVRQELLRPPWPASTGVVCAELLRPEFALEVDPTAVLPG